MGFPRIVFLNVYNRNVHRNFIMFIYMSSPFGADGLINKINLFNSTGVTESYITNTHSLLLGHKEGGSEESLQYRVSEMSHRGAAG